MASKKSPKRDAPRATTDRETSGTALDVGSFLKIANKFVELANKQNQTIAATDLHMAFLWAASRYNAHVAKAILDVNNHEQFVADMTKHYQEMLRQHLADPTLGPPKT